MANVDRAAELLQLIRQPGGGSNTGAGNAANNLGFKVLTVVTTEPAPYTFIFEGTSQALDIDLFEIPVSLYPLRKGDKLLVFPLVGTELGQRWAALEKLNGGVTMATMQSASSLTIDGIDKIYSGGDLLIPPYIVESPTILRPLQEGDTVSIAPTLVGDKIKYVVLERY